MKSSKDIIYLTKCYKNIFIDKYTHVKECLDITLDQERNLFLLNEDEVSEEYLERFLENFLQEEDFDFKIEITTYTNVGYLRTLDFF